MERARIGSDTVDRTMIVPTRRTALLAGALTTFRQAAFGTWAQDHVFNPSLGTFIYMSLWVIPAVLFAIGYDRKRWDPDYVRTPAFKPEMREMYFRIGFWYGGQLAGGLLLATITR